MGTHSSILARSIPWTEEPGGLQSTRVARVGRDSVTKPPGLVPIPSPKEGPQIRLQGPPAALSVQAPGSWCSCCPSSAAGWLACAETSMETPVTTFGAARVSWSPLLNWPPTPGASGLSARSRGTCRTPVP